MVGCYTICIERLGCLQNSSNKIKKFPTYLESHLQSQNSFSTLFLVFIASQLLHIPYLGLNSGGCMSSMQFLTPLGSRRYVHIWPTSSLTHTKGNCLLKKNIEKTQKPALLTRNACLWTAVRTAVRCFHCYSPRHVSGVEFCFKLIGLSVLRFWPSWKSWSLKILVPNIFLYFLWCFSCFLWLAVFLVLKLQWKCSGVTIHTHTISL